MRPSRLLSSAITMITLLSIAMMTQASAPSQQPPYRIIEVNENGLVFVYDVLPAVGSPVRVGFPRSLIVNLINYECLEDPSPELVVEDDFFWIAVDDISGGVAHLLTVFRDVVSWDSASQTFSLEMPAHPRVEGLGRTDFSLEVRLPEDAELAEISPGYLNQTGPGVVSGLLRGADLSRESVEDVSLRFSSGSLRLLDVVSARLVVEAPERVIKLSLRLRLYGGPQLSEVRLRLPEGVELIRVEDGLGRLSSSAKDGEVAVTLRQPLREMEMNSFTVIARADEKSELFSLSGGELAVGLPIPLNTTFWIYEVEIRLKGGEPRSWSIEPIEFRREYPDETVLVYRFDHVDPVNAGELRISLSYEPRFSFFQAMPYLVLASLILFASSIMVVYRPRGKVAEKRAGETLFDEAGLLMEAYQRIMGLISSERVYDRGLARRALLDLRSEVRRGVESIRKLGGELRMREPRLAEQVDGLLRSVKDFQQAVERTWGEIYPYLSKSMPRSRLDEVLERCRRDLKSCYDAFASRLEDLRRALG